MKIIAQGAPQDSKHYIIYLFIYLIFYLVCNFYLEHGISEVLKAIDPKKTVTSIFCSLFVHAAMYTSCFNIITHAGVKTESA